MGMHSDADSGEGYFSSRFHKLWCEHAAKDPFFGKALKFPCATWSTEETIRYSNEHAKFKKQFLASDAGRGLLWERHIRDNYRLHEYVSGARSEKTLSDITYNQRTRELLLAERLKFDRAYDKYFGGPCDG